MRVIHFQNYEDSSSFRGCLEGGWANSVMHQNMINPRPNSVLVNTKFFSALCQTSLFVVLWISAQRQARPCSSGEQPLFNFAFQLRITPDKECFSMTRTAGPTLRPKLLYILRMRSLRSLAQSQGRQGHVAPFCKLPCKCSPTRHGPCPGWIPAPGEGQDVPWRLSYP